jgi:hypothetical protein
MTDWDNERRNILATFHSMLAAVTGDGSLKRQRSEKPPWYEDASHMAAVWSHFRRREQGEFEDPDSGVHPYVHAAWRLLAIAYQETVGRVEPRGFDE